MGERAGSGRRITHVELLYRPGERALAAKVFTLLGCEAVDRGGQFFTALIDPSAPRDYVENVLYASEVGPAQWELEQALATGTTEAHAAFIAAMRRSPQHSTHFGFRVPDEPSLDAIVARVERAGRDDPELAGRVAVDGVFRPGEPGSIAPTLVQAFIWTDVVAAGLLTLGQHIEVQWHLPQAS
jgi:hypothetical protein